MQRLVLVSFLFKKVDSRQVEDNSDVQVKFSMQMQACL